MSKRACENCGHRADYHHALGSSPCGQCSCETLNLPALKKPLVIGTAVCRDKLVVDLLEAGAMAVVCFGCMEHIEPGEMFIRRTRRDTWSDKGHPFCLRCFPVDYEGIEEARESRGVRR